MSATAAALSRGDEAVDNGRWWIEGNELCQRWLGGKAYKLSKTDFELMEVHNDCWSYFLTLSSGRLTLKPTKTMCRVPSVISSPASSGYFFGKAPTSLRATTIATG